MLFHRQLFSSNLPWRHYGFASFFVSIFLGFTPRPWFLTTLISFLTFLLFYDSSSSFEVYFFSVFRRLNSAYPPYPPPPDGNFKPCFGSVFYIFKNICNGEFVWSQRFIKKANFSKGGGWGGGQDRVPALYIADNFRAIFSFTIEFPNFWNE